MSDFFGMKQQRHALLNHAEALAATAERENRSMTEQETSLFGSAMDSVKRMGKDIEAIESKNTLMSTLRATGGMLIPGNPDDLSNRVRQASRLPLGNNMAEMPIATLSADYMTAFEEWVSSCGQRTSAALYEGGNAAGGYAVPVITDGVVVPLAPQEMAVRRLARVVTTTNDLKVPVKATFGTAGIKAESGASTNAFTDSDVTISQFELTSYMVGRQTSASWELLQDVQQFNSFIVDDLLLSVQQFEENQFVLGSGTGEPQGLIGNTGAGVTGVVNAASNLLDATYDVQATLNAAYHGNASFLMARSTGVALRKAQKQANLFEPVFTRSNGVDYLHGYPVQYSASMPSMAASATPVIFGDFNAGYIIGDRGGAGISVKFLDQIKAASGQLVLLAYRRTDGRVRRSEALQAITIAAS